LTVAYGQLRLRELYLGSIQEVRAASLRVGGESIAATFAAEDRGWTVLLGEELLLERGQTLAITTS
jgi:hypothetical protein